MKKSITFFIVFFFITGLNAQDTVMALLDLPVFKNLKIKPEAQFGYMIYNTYFPYLKESLYLGEPLSPYVDVTGFDIFDFALNLRYENMRSIFRIIFVPPGGTNGYVRRYSGDVIAELNRNSLLLELEGGYMLLNDLTGVIIRFEHERISLGYSDRDNFNEALIGGDYKISNVMLIIPLNLIDKKIMVSYQFGILLNGRYDYKLYVIDKYHGDFGIPLREVIGESKIFRGFLYSIKTEYSFGKFIIGLSILYKWLKSEDNFSERFHGLKLIIRSK
jgi:hypothetical protein